MSENRSMTINEILTFWSDNGLSNKYCCDIKNTAKSYPLDTRLSRLSELPEDIATKIKDTVFYELPIGKLIQYLNANEDQINQIKDILKGYAIENMSFSNLKDKDKIVNKINQVLHQNSIVSSELQPVSKSEFSVDQWFSDIKKIEKRYKLDDLIAKLPEDTANNIKDTVLYNVSNDQLARCLNLNKEQIAKIKRILKNNNMTTVKVSDLPRKVVNEIDGVLQSKYIIDSDEKSINEIDKIKKSAVEELIDACREIYSRRKGANILNKDLKGAKDQNNKLKKEKSELVLVSKLNKMETKVSECKGQQNDTLETLWNRYVVLKEKNNNLEKQLSKSKKDNANLKAGNKKFQKTLNKLQKKIVNLETKNNQIKRTNTIDIKRRRSNQSILEKANKLKIKFTQVPEKKPTLENNSINQI